MMAGGVLPFIIGEARKTQRVQAGLHGLHFRKLDQNPTKDVQPTPRATDPTWSSTFDATRLLKQGASETLSALADAQPFDLHRASQLE